MTWVFYGVMAMGVVLLPDAGTMAVEALLLWIEG